MKRKQEKPPRGLTVRGNSITADFALADGTIALRSVGTVGVTSPQECQRKRLDFLREVERGTYAPPEARVNVTVYRVRGPLARISARLSQRRRQGCRVKLRVEEVSADSVNQYIESRRAAGRENGTINRETAMLRAMFNHGRRVSPPLVDRIPWPAQRERSAERILHRCRVCKARQEREGFMAALFDCGLV